MRSELETLFFGNGLTGWASYGLDDANQPVDSIQTELPDLLHQGMKYQRMNKVQRIIHGLQISVLQ